LQITLHVAHLNHLIRGEEAKADAQFVESLAQEWELPATIEERDVPAYTRENQMAIEEAARQVRYSFLAKVAHEVGAKTVAVGHSADDQVETILMHWLRGSGLAGLRGMRPIQGWPMPGEDLRLVRPLLEVPRAEIEAYCEENGLKPRFDRSNLDTTYYRNRLRLELLPTLETYNPNIREVLRRAAVVITDDYDYLTSRGKTVWDRIVSQVDGTLVFDLEAWEKLHPSLKRQLLRRAIRQLRRELRNIDWVHIELAMTTLGEKPTGTEITLPQGLRLFKSYDTFAIGEARPLPDMPLIEGEMELKVPGITPLGEWEVVAEILEGEVAREMALANRDARQAYLDSKKTGEHLMVRGRQSGDRFQPLGMAKEKSLREFMIDSKIPRHIRDRLPIIQGKHILWVTGYRIDERARVTKRTVKILRLELRKGERWARG
jgi:tRNA(Ile)-lysidine synthase